MAITVEGVPESITREQMVEWLASIGIDASHVRLLRVATDGIVVESYALDPSGRRFAMGDEVATHKVSIRIVDPKPPTVVA